MRSSRLWVSRLAALLLGGCAAQLPGGPTFAWGPAGHIITGFAAAPLLCEDAVAEIRMLGDGESLGRIGLWADEIRRDPQWRHAAAWHYVNIPDGGDPRDPPATPAGNVVSAIDRFAREVADRSLVDEQRAIALRFLVHFVADLHQPVHVGRASDRGGNLIDVRYDDVTVNLHAFWDSHVIDLSGRSIREYVDFIADDVKSLAPREIGTDVLDWTEQVFALREDVYEFDAQTGRLDAEYIEFSVGAAERQLALAAVHLAATLNGAFCR